MLSTDNQREQRSRRHFSLLVSVIAVWFLAVSAAFAVVPASADDMGMEALQIPLLSEILTRAN